jgi:hypothetical protein
MLCAGTQLEEFIFSTLDCCNRFTARSPRLSSVSADGDRGSAHASRRQGPPFRSRRRAPPSRPGHPGRGHLDPYRAVGARTPFRAHRVVGHHGAGLRLPARPGDVGAIYPPSAVVACPSYSPFHTTVPLRRCLIPSRAWRSQTHRRPRPGPHSTGRHAITAPSSSSSTTRSRIDKPWRRD